MEGLHERHGSSDNGGDECSSPDQLPYCHARTIAVHGSKGRKDVRTAVSQSQKRDASNLVAQVQDMGDSVEVDTEEVTSDQAKSGKEDSEPCEKENHYKGFGSCKSAIVYTEVGEYAIVFLATVLTEKCTLVLDMVNMSTVGFLEGLSRLNA